MQYTLRVTNKSEPSHFTASWVRSQQVKRKSPFSLPKGDRNLVIYSLGENENSTDSNFLVSSQILSL